MAGCQARLFRIGFHQLTRRPDLLSLSPPHPALLTAGGERDKVCSEHQVPIRIRYLLGPSMRDHVT